MAPQSQRLANQHRPQKHDRDDTAAMSCPPKCDHDHEKGLASKSKDCVRPCKGLRRRGREDIPGTTDQSALPVFPYSGVSFLQGMKFQSQRPCTVSLRDLKVVVVGKDGIMTETANVQTRRSYAKSTLPEENFYSSIDNAVQEAGTIGTDSSSGQIIEDSVPAASNLTGSSGQIINDDDSDDNLSSTTIGEADSDSDSDSDVGDNRAWFTIIRKYAALSCERFRRFIALLDTGSPVNVISSKFLAPQDYKIQGSEMEPMIILGFGNGTVPVNGIARLVCELERADGKPKKRRIKFYAVSEEHMSDYDVIMSKNTSKKLKLVCFPRGMCCRVGDEHK